MPTLHDSALMGVSTGLSWVKPPDGGLEKSLTTFGGVSDLVNGGAAVVASRYGARKFTLAWSYLTAEQMRTLRGILSFPGDRPVTYIDRQSVLADNCLSPLLGRPGLHAEALSPLAFDNNGVRLAANAPMSSGVGDVLEILGKQPTDGLVHSYSEDVVIPAGYDLWVATTGTNPERVVRANRTPVGGQAVKLAGSPTAHTRATISLEPNWQSARVAYVRGVLSPIGGPAKGAAYYDPEGVAGLRVVPGSYQETAVVLGRGYQVWSVSVEMQEVWPWL